MYCVAILITVALASVKGSTELESEAEPKLPYTVKSFDYKLPPVPVSEGRATNDALFFVRFPQYSIIIRLFCPYQLIETKFLTKRKDDFDNCISKVDLTYWCKEKKVEVVLDSYEIIRNDLSDRGSIDSITVYKAPADKTHHVTLAMDNHTCRRMEYSVGDDLSVTKKNFEMDCKEVDKLNKENDEWVKEHIMKDIEAAKKGAKKKAPRAPIKDANKEAPKAPIKDAEKENIEAAKDAEKEALPVTPRRRPY